MNSLSPVLATDGTSSRSLKCSLDAITDELLMALPAPSQLSPTARRGIIARYAAVLEGNFIYWMTGAYLAARSEQAKSIILDNLLEEVRDSHPLMLRRFTMAANAPPTESDVAAVDPRLTGVRLFVGRLSAPQLLTMMAFFESFIQKFMPYLEELAVKQGSLENEYTQVHGVCDIAHSEGLFRALETEMTFSDDVRDPAEYLLEGVHLLRALIDNIFTGPSAAAA